jgi:hypothetical protein
MNFTVEEDSENIMHLANGCSPKIVRVSTKETSFALKGKGILGHGVLGDFIVKEDNKLIVYSPEDFHEKFTMQEVT